MLACPGLRRVPSSLLVAYRVLPLFILVLAASACVSGAPADVKAKALVAQSTATAELFKARQKDANLLFNAALRDAKGIMIFPEILEIAVGVGGQGGPGVMLTRDTNGAWGYPAFYRLSGGSLGVQVGAHSRELVFLLMSDSSVRDVINSPSQFAIGSQATFGEASAGSGGGTNIKGANIIGFTKGSGVFAGVALSGAYVSSLQALNQSYYNSGSATPTAILIDHAFTNPDADQLRQALTVK
jgi:lipid-binding SYLF domain-containing protein